MSRLTRISMSNPNGLWVTALDCTNHMDHGLIIGTIDRFRLASADFTFVAI